MVRGSFLSFKCINTNIDGIVNNVGDLSNLDNKENPDIIMLTETKLYSEVMNISIIDTEKCNLFRHTHQVVGYIF